MGTCTVVALGRDDHPVRIDLMLLMRDNQPTLTNSGGTTEVVSFLLSLPSGSPMRCDLHEAVRLVAANAIDSKAFRCLDLASDLGITAPAEVTSPAQMIPGSLLHSDCNLDMDRWFRNAGSMPAVEAKPAISQDANLPPVMRLHVCARVCRRAVCTSMRIRVCVQECACRIVCRCCRVILETFGAAFQHRDKW